MGVSQMHYRQNCARLQTMNDSWTLEPNRVILSHPPNTANISSAPERPTKNNHKLKN